MADKNYFDYIAFLRTREARPSFERTKELLAAKERVASGYFSVGRQIRNWAIGIASLALLVLLATKAAMPDFPNAKQTTLAHPQSPALARSGQFFAGTHHSENLNGTHGQAMIRSSSNHISPKAFLSSQSAEQFGTSDADAPSRDSAIPDENSASSQRVIAMRVDVAAIQPSANNLKYQVPKNISIPEVQSFINRRDNSTKDNLFLTVGGSLSGALGFVWPVSKMASEAFFGGGYHVTSSLTIGLVGWRESFALKQPTYSTTFTDTQFVHNGNPYSNIIGHIDTGSTPLPTQIYSIGATLRYSFGEGASNPYAEIFGGGSAQGPIVGVAFGLNVFRIDQLFLDAGAFCRALIPSGGATLTKLGGSLQVRYDL